MGVWAGAQTPNWSACLAYDAQSKQVATLALTGLKSFKVGPVCARWTAFAGQEIQNPLSKGSAGSVAGTGLEIDSLFRVSRTQMFFNVGAGQGFESGSDGSHWLAWVGIGITFK
jgi:hypothetical protein